VPATLFIALVPPPEALAPLVAAVDRLRPTAPGLGWVSPRKWHVTLCFLGRGEPSGALEERLGRVAARHVPPPLRIAGAGRFGDRVLFAKLAGELKPLAAGVARAAAKAGYPVEDRPFRAHLTLARGRRTRVDLRPLVAELAETTGPEWTPQELVLLQGATPQYLRVAGWPFPPG
jgi:2'-5' RNA ligase